MAPGPERPDSFAEGSRAVWRARFVAPLSSPPIENGAVVIQNGRVAEVGSWNVLKPRHSGPVTDLGEAVILPGLVNAHCHLDYTNMAGQIPPPKHFPDWIKALLALKAHWTFSDYARSWINGARMLLRSGVTLAGDIEAVPELLPDAWNATPLRLCSFFEMTGVQSRREPAEILREAVAFLSDLPNSEAHFSGLSPHAPYSTTPELLRLAADEARRLGLRVATHAAESEAESEMFSRASGPFYQWLKSQRDMADCGHGSPIEALFRCGLLGPNFLAIHANYLEAGDADRLAASGSHVVHCPRSHDYFGHAPFPFAELARAGVNVCLGTDSLVSTRREGEGPLELDLFSEMRVFQKAHPDVGPETILRLATQNGAKALGLAGRAGEISPGSFADLIALPFAGGAGGLFESVIQHRPPVSWAIIGGAIAPLPAPEAIQYLPRSD